MYINNIIKIQRFIRYKLYYKHYNDIFNNIKKLNNNIDPITLNNIYKKSKIKKIEKLYPIFRNNKMYIYELVSLKELIKLNLGEVYTNTSFTKTEINKINFLTRNIKTRNKKITKDEELFFLKTDIFQIFNELDTYFTFALYESIDKSKLRSIFIELKLLWNKYLEDYNINEYELIKHKLNWNQTSNFEYYLLNNIYKMINNDIDKTFKKHICYIIIGSFCYVEPNIKNLFNDIEFI
jgi:hypothetical protein